MKLCERRYAYDELSAGGSGGGPVMRSCTAISPLSLLLLCGEGDLSVKPVAPRPARGEDDESGDDAVPDEEEEEEGEVAAGEEVHVAIGDFVNFRVSVVEAEALRQIRARARLALVKRALARAGRAAAGAVTDMMDSSAVKLVTDLLSAQVLWCATVSVLARV